MARRRISFAAALVLVFLGPACFKAPDSGENADPNGSGDIDPAGIDVGIQPEGDDDDGTTDPSSPTNRLPCISCHQLDLGDRRAVVLGSGDGSHHFGADPQTNDDCVICHEISKHQGGIVRLWANPNNPNDILELTGRPRIDIAAADKLVPFCTSCHSDYAHNGHPVSGGWQPSCTTCHDLHNPGSENLALVGSTITHAGENTGSPVIFTARQGSGSFDDGDPAAMDGVCQVCHTQTVYHKANGTGISHNDGTNCTTCHTHETGFLPTEEGSCVDCHSTTQGSRAAVVDEAGTGGHHLGAGTLIDEDCSACHEMTRHRQGQVRLWNNPNARTTAFEIPASSPLDPSTDNKLNDFCNACHPGNQIHGVTGNWQPSCNACHALHDRNNTNLSLIRTQVRSASFGQDRNVVFQTKTGAGSFSDGVGDNDGICQVCHTATSYHLQDGGGVAHNTGADCTGCHKHEAGFVPSTATSCIDCHSNQQGARRAVLAEFELLSHHASGATVKDADCLACHDQSQHQQGIVRLKNADNAALVVELTGDPLTDPVEAVKLEPFCLSCHDQDGAGGSPPFADGLNPVAINPDLWSATSHKTGQVTCVGDGETFGCHSTGHGSMKLNLLAPSDASQSPLAGDPLRQEEGFCYGCHGANGPASTNIEAIFGLASRHDVSSLDQSGGAKVECVNCHDPHKANVSSVLIHPDNGAVFEGGVTEFCLTCHDGNPPASVQFPLAMASGSGFDKSAFVGSVHDTQLGADACLDCHDPHGSPHIANLLNRYVVEDDNNYSTGDGDYASCWACHDENETIQQENRFDEYHKKHVKGEDAPCIACHNAHNAYDPGEPGLIDLSHPAEQAFSFSFIDGADASTAFWINDTGSKGNCLLRCHGEKHNPEDYRR